MMNRPARRVSRRSVSTQSAEREYSYEEFGQCFDGFWRRVAVSLKPDSARPELSLTATAAYAISGAPVERPVHNFVDYDFLPVAESREPVIAEKA